jgi:hypothetical protein
MKIAYLDIETDYVGPFNDKRLFRDHKNHNITILGLRILDAEPDSASPGAERELNDQFFQFTGDDLSRETLLLTLGGVRKIVTYNGRSMPDDVKRSVGFDFPVIAAQYGIVLDREFAHTDLVPECWRRGLFGGLKEVERKLGLVRELPGKDGFWATQTWRKFRETRDQRLLDEVLLYNREDVYMLRAVELKLRSIPSTLR